MKKVILYLIVISAVIISAATIALANLQVIESFKATVSSGSDAVNIE
jgi:hypothetical protein